MRRPGFGSRVHPSLGLRSRQGSAAWPGPRTAKHAESASRSPRRLGLPSLLVGSALLLGGLALALGAMSHPGGSVVLVASRTLPAGTRLRASDLVGAGIDADRGLVSTLVPAAQKPSVVGDVLTAPLLSGEPLARAAVSPEEPAAFTLTVVSEHALGGALRPGDRISVLATFETPSGGALTRELARGLLVLAVGQPPSIGDPTEATIPVTVALPDPAVASALALANEVGHVDLLRDGPGTSARIPPVSEPGAAG